MCCVRLSFTQQFEKVLQYVIIAEAVVGSNPVTLLVIPFPFHSIKNIY